MSPKRGRAGLLALLLGLVAWAAQAAGIPGAYAPLVIEATGLPERAEFDLGPAQARARQEGKSLYVYLGAAECPYCRRYEAFLTRNAAELVPLFQRKYIVVDLRSSLRYGGVVPLFIKGSGASLPYAEFQRSIGDERARQLVYPSVWLFDANLKPLMSMPAGTGTFQTVPEQIEILELVQ
ncbi:thioredoxin family protein [Rivibacter subsaxonicus]|uniref:Thioredoxin-related protein n=1 Tax=Rivibacter subsaxonicus TaxID=457575 RepID=A0A4Q7W145_9BURK|nr:thioredoxin family protein [Rivibacter subsaxonicus]RZU02972.1 hypothetical protein EV670_1003 [Rivibacter subsaxonicus]